MPSFFLGQLLGDSIADSIGDYFGKIHNGPRSAKSWFYAKISMKMRFTILFGFLQIEDKVSFQNDDQ